MPRRTSRHLPILCSAILGLAASAEAAVITWTNAGVGNWNDPANWSSNTIPTTADDGRINNGGTALIDASQSVAVGFAILGDLPGTSGTLRMTGGQLETNFDIRIGGNGAGAGNNGTGVFDQSGGVVRLIGGNVNVGFGVNGVGTYNLSGGSVHVDAAFIMAVGNTGTGTVNQSGGSVYIRSGTTPVNSVIQLGRNSATVPASGTYTLSGGIAAARNFDFGRQVQTSGTMSSTNTFNLQGTGTLITNGIRLQNTAAVNTFNFTGGTLVANSTNMSLTNDGGTLRPDFADFTGVPLTIDAIPINRISTLNFTNGSSYTQTANGILAIDLASTGNDLLSLGGGLSVATANIAGTIAVSLVNGFNPTLGSTFDIVAATTVTSIAQIDGTTPDGYSFSQNIVNGADGRQVLQLVVVPEPGTATLFALGLLGAGMRRQRRRLAV